MAEQRFSIQNGINPAIALDHDVRPEAVNGQPAIDDRSASPTTANSNAEVAPEAVIRAEQRFATLLGAALSLMIRSPMHRNLFISEFERRVLPPLALEQCRLFVSKGMPFAFVTWAMVNDEVASRLKSSPARLQSPEWNCGSNFVIVDIVAPFGGADRCLAEIEKTRADQAQGGSVMPETSSSHFTTELEEDGRRG
jgi:cytolysin-activating lysine-acyltransferase